MDQNDTIQSAEREQSPSKAPSVGERLREARLARGQSLKDVAATTRQSIDLLEAMEDMRTDHVAPTILRMQARTYAAFLGLPSDEIVAGFSAARSLPDSASMPGEVLRSGRVAARRRLWPIAAAAAVIIAGGLVFWSLPSAPTSRAPTSVASRLAVPTRAGETANSPAATKTVAELTIRANASGWIEVRGSDGTIFRSRTMAAGDVYYPRMDAAWTVTVRDAGAFEWWLGEAFISTLGPAGVAVYSVSIDEATTRAREQLSTALADVAPASPRPR